MRLPLLIAAIGAIAQSRANAQDPVRIWARQFGTPAGDWARALAPDGHGGVYVGGSTHGNLFGPPAPAVDGFFARLDSGGRLLWGRQLSIEVANVVEAVARSADAAVFVCGYTGGSLGGPNAGQSDAFVAKYTSDGAPIWTRQLGSARDESVTAALGDDAGGAFVAGWTNGDLAATNPGAPFYPDAFIARYDSSGGLLWVRQFGTPYSEIFRGLAPDGTGGCFAAGLTGGSIAATNPNLGTDNPLITRYNGAGDRLWVRQIPTHGQGYAAGAASDGAGGVVIAGGTDAPLVVRFDGDGNQVWSRSPQGISLAVAPTDQGGVYVVGNLFVRRFDSAGTQNWSTQIGSGGGTGSACAPDGRGGVFAGGRTFGNLGGPNAGDSDAMVVRYGPCPPNCDNSTVSPVLNVDDFVCFINRYAGGDPYANCDGSVTLPLLTAADFTCFAQQFSFACP